MITAEQRAALIDALAVLVLEDRRREAEHNPKKPPYYFINISHPVIRVFYLQWMAKHNEAAPPGDRSAGTVRRCLCASDAHPPPAACFRWAGSDGAQRSKASAASRLAARFDTGARHNCGKP